MLSLTAVDSTDSGSTADLRWVMETLLN